MHEVNLAEARTRRKKKATHRYLYRWHKIDLQVQWVPCIVDNVSTNFYWITFWNPEREDWTEACVCKHLKYVEAADASTEDKKL